MAIFPLLAVSGLTCHYGQRTVLEDIQFEIHEGQMVALLGPNGSGKSTLMKAVAGLIPWEEKGRSGQILYRGDDLCAFDPRQRARVVAYLGPDIRADFPMTAREAVLLGRICHGIDHGAALLSGFNAQDEAKVLWAMQQALCWDLRDRDISTLSGGERQLVGLARSLAQDARLLFLDEALSRMDLNHVALISKMLRRRLEEGYAVLLVSHDINLASELADQCLLLRQGKQIAKGRPESVLTAEKIGQLYPGADIRLGIHPVTGVPLVFLKG